MFDYDKAFDGVQRSKPIDVLHSKSTDDIIENFNGDKRQQHNGDDSCPKMHQMRLYCVSIVIQSVCRHSSLKIFKNPSDRHLPKQYSD